MKKLLLMKSLFFVCITGFASVATGHGLIVDPPARNAHCGLNEKADQATTPACLEAAQEDFNGLYQFMSVLTHDIGRMGGTSTHVCGFDSETWQGGATPWDLPLDWPTTSISSGATTFTWNISWGPHWDDTEEFRYWITKPGFNYQVGAPLSWTDFEDDPFCVLMYDDSAPNSNPNVVTEKSANLFHTTCDLPARSGRHVIYGEWGRNHFTYERFHGCVDVTFGAVTSSSASVSSSPTSSASIESSSSSAIMSSLAASSTANSSSAPSSMSSDSASSSSIANNTARLLCDYVVVNEWNTGFVADVRLTNTGNDIVENWEVQWTYDDGSSVVYLWNANAAGENPYTATGVQWNSSVLPGQTVVFGFVGSKGGTSVQSVQVTGEHCE